MGPRSSTGVSPVAVALVGLAAVALGVASLLGALRAFGGDPLEATSPVGASAPEVEEGDGWVPWARNADGSPVRWDPCGTIELVVDPTGAYEGFERDLDAAVADAEAASGLDIELAGDTDERPHATRPLYLPEEYGQRWAPVLVAFAEPQEGGLPLLDTDRAIAAPVAVGTRGDRVYVSGQIVLNAERDDMEPGDDDRATSWGATLRHELGHLLGLDHIDDPDELMHAFPEPGPAEFGEGDLRGLGALGSGGCLQEPSPQHLDVEVGADP